MSRTQACHQVAPGVFQLDTDYPSVCDAPLWAYLIGDDGEWGLIDPGIASTFDAMLAEAVSSAGCEPSALRQLLVTHGHPDHTGGLRSWKQAAPGALVAAPLEEVPWVESFDRQWRRCWDDYPGTLDLSDTREFYTSLCVPDESVQIILRDGDTIEAGGREVRVIETRGHTWGHCAFFDPGSGALFCGDAVQGRGGASCSGNSVFAPMYLDVDEARTGLRRLLAVPFQILCPAHHPPMQRARAVSFIEESLAFIDEIDALARGYVEHAETPSTRGFAEAIGAVVGTNPPLSPQTAFTARAHLYALARDGLLEATWGLK